MNSKSGLSMKNLGENLSVSQKMWFLLGAVVIVVLVIVLAGLLSGSNEDDVVNIDADNSNIADDSENVDDENISIEYNDNHVYTLEEYLPRTSYDYVEYGDGETGARIHYTIAENTAIEKGIVVQVNACNEEVNKQNADAFLKTIPVNLSEYEIDYQTEYDEMPCDAKISE